MERLSELLIRVEWLEAASFKAPSYVTEPEVIEDTPKYYLHRSYNVTLDGNYPSAKLFRRVENLENQITSLKKFFNLELMAKKKGKQYKYDK
ncbi:hypothetical protein LCGC14_0514380 [marine sediment metagenome]|uniref:Uncharacterized protein n=1 Tax=marine sediment metagenome TaxID=412755 RepID=A0A0F9S507_9ZZZZ